MTGSIETITDRKRFDEIFNATVFVADVYMKTSSGGLKIKFMGYNGGQIAFKVPFIKSMPDSALAYARHNDTTIYIELKTVEKQENDIFIFVPIKVQLFHAARQEGRVEISGDHKNLVFVSGVTSDFLLFDSIKREKRRVEMLRDRIHTDLSKVFTEIKIHFNPEESADPRMIYFYQFGNAPLFIPQLGVAPAKGEEAKAAYYREQIYLKEQFNMKRKGLISEIAVPILYRGMVPIGYIQINNTVPFNESYIQVLKRASQLAAQTLEKMSIFTDICPDRLLVSDLSKNGISIVFRDRKYIRFIKEKNVVFFNMVLGDGHEVPACAIVKNIALMENKVIKVGCAMREISPEHYHLYESYLSTAVHDTPPPPAAPANPSPSAPLAAASVDSPVAAAAPETTTPQPDEISFD